MPRDPRYDVLFEPLRIGPKTMRNRFYQVPHCANFGVDYPATHARFRGTKAEGGWAVVNTEYCSIHPESDDHPRTAAQLWDDRDVRNAARMCDEIHAHGALAGVELWYGGPHASNVDSRMAARGVSQIATETNTYQTSCYEMDKAAIRELQDFYVQAALRAQTAGFDLVNVFGGQTHTITQQFLDPFYNKRTDEYGGSFENRARFWLEVIELVRAAVGDNMAVVARIGMDTDRADGLTTEDACRFMATADHLIDLWDLTTGNGIEWGEDVGPSRSHKENFQQRYALKAREYTQKPIVGVGRFVSPDVMVAAIRSGQLDVIGAARPSIADPFLPNKIEAGRLDSIRECIGCNICISRVWGVNTKLICTQNPTAGEEFRRGWHPEEVSRAANADNDVLVVGAGPAGMECAMILGKRGMRRVHLVDERADLGGSLGWVSRLPGLGEWGRVTDYRKGQIAKLRNVQFIGETDLDADAIAEYGAEFVVLAVGATWALDGLSSITHATIPGADATLEWQYTPDQVMDQGKPVSGERVLVYDSEGYFVAVGVAEKLASEGHAVTFVTPFSQVAPYTQHTGEYFYIYRRLAALGVNMVTNQVLTSIERGHGVSRHSVVRERLTHWNPEAVVLVTQRLSRNGLWTTLTEQRERLHAAGVAGLFRVGDCVAPRTIADAVFDGHRLAREIDSTDPGTPLRPIRENLVLERDISEEAVTAGEVASAPAG